MARGREVLVEGRETREEPVAEEALVRLRRSVERSFAGEGRPVRRGSRGVGREPPVRSRRDGATSGTSIVRDHALSVETSHAVVDLNAVDAAPTRSSLEMESDRSVVDEGASTASRAGDGSRLMSG